MRESGVLMHITSLPGKYGVGTMGKTAFEFVDFLKKAGQRCWQILPLTPTGYGDSPYQSCSTFAGNHYLIDLDLLVEQGLLKQEEIENIRWNDTEEKVNFGLLYNHKLDVLRIAHSRFAGGEAFENFCRENSSWLSDFALFMALKERSGGQSWYSWEKDLKFRNPDAIWKVRQELRETIQFYCFVQYIFYTQWAALRAYAHENDIRIIGDVPIYVPLDSADVWSNPELFQLDEKLDPVAVAILCTAGISWRRMITAGGSAVWPPPAIPTMWCVWTISVALKATGLCLPAKRPPRTASGSRVPTWTL